MGKNSRARRDARRRTHPRPTPPGSPGGRRSGGADVTQADLVDLISTASGYASVSTRAAAPRIAQLVELSAAATDDSLDPAVLVVDEALSMIRNAWEHGWQPAELVHAARRRTSAAAATWMARAVLVEAGRTGAADRAPAAWVDQLRSLSSRRAGDGLELLLPPRGRAAAAEWTPALIVLDFVHRLPRSQLLMPPPSQWGRAQASPRRAPRPGDDRAKTLTRIRALLAKAESTDFEAEAEAFTAKAQDLMTRHAIDEALLVDELGGSVEVEGIRVLIHHPYAVEKAGLLDVIARANRSRVVWNDFASCATVVGVPTDVAQVEMLFTSTLVQATRAMTRAGEASHGLDRSSSFRKAFLSAYAYRIGERLAASAQEAVATYGSVLVPVFERQAAAVESEFERLFPHVSSGPRRSRFDARGWDAGTRAADEAVLPAGEVES